MSRLLRAVSRFAPFLSLTGLIVGFFHKMTFTNLILGRGDILLYFYPYWSAAAHALRGWQAPLWNPHLFMGAPLLANSQVGFFYPLNWPLWLAFSAPYAVSASILLHLAIAAAGTYMAGRRALGLSRAAALVAAVLFALGGYLTAQVEHVNQLQGLAWLPWALAVCHPAADCAQPSQWRPAAARRAAARKGLGLAVVFALQLTAGHAQTVFITGVGLALWLGTAGLRQGVGERESGVLFWLRRAFRPGLPLLLGAGGALALAAVQLLPTLELVQHSSRQGGLLPNEVLSFSLHPLLVGRALLPAYGQALFTEYVAYLPLTALLLALVGAWRWRKRAAVLPLLVLAIAGLFLALGRFNPLAYVLVQLPGFNLFRAPARWLALYALGSALLAGVGWEALFEGRMAEREGRRPLRVGLALIFLLIVWSLLAALLSDLVPTGEEAPVVAPSLAVLGGWLVEAAAAYVLLTGSRPRFLEGRRVAPALLVLVLFLGSRSLPYNHLTTPDAYFELRPPIARLRALASCDLLPEACRAASPGRMLSLSDIFFDLGDQAEIEAIYGDQLPPDAVYDYVVATKHKEVLTPNLPLTYGLASVDGFDGGILPLRSYTELAGLILPAGVESTDGRLREYLDDVPDPRWLDLFNARYLITDKVGDVWRDGVFFDTQHSAVLAPGDAAPVGYVPPYEATEVRLLGEGEAGSVYVASGGSGRLLTPERVGDVWRVAFAEPLVPETISLQGPERGEWTVRGVALVDGRDDSFQTLTPGQYRLIHSGDVKIYENLDALPRAFFVPAWTWRPDVASSVAALADPAFRPGEEAVIVGEGEPAVHDLRPASVEVVQYRPEEVVVHAQLEGDGLLVLTDAYYPGWRVTVNGERRPLYQVDGLFRGVMAPAGNHEIVFRFESRAFVVGRAISVAALLVVVAFVAGWVGRVFGRLSFRE